MSLSAPLHWAAPSWVIPGTVAENARFLAGKTPEIALCLFETESCLNYKDVEMPEEKLPVHWHLHLPVDLPWHEGTNAVAAICAKLCEKFAYLKPKFAVLHAPEAGDKASQLAAFARNWKNGTQILLENTKDCAIWELGAGFLADNNFGLCIDVAHALVFKQDELLEAPFIGQASLFHWSAPCDADKHQPLAFLTEREKEISKRALLKAKKDATHLLEIFNWRGVEASLAVLARLAGESHDI